MKRMKIIGIIALVLAGIVLLTGVFSLLLRADNGLFSDLLASSTAAQEAVTTAQANAKSADSALRKAESAVGAARKARDSAEKAQTALDEVLSTLQSHSEDGDTLHALFYAVEDAQTGMTDLQAAVDSLDELVEGMLGAGGALQNALGMVGEQADITSDAIGNASQQADALLLSSLRDTLADAIPDVDKAESAEADARKAVNKVMLAVNGTQPLTEGMPFPFAVEPPATIEETVSLEAVTQAEHAKWLATQAEETQVAAQDASAAAQTAQAGTTITGMDRVIDLIANYYIAIWFTGLLLLAIGILLTFFGPQFARQWKGNPVFSTFVALIVMLIIQVYSMRFTYPTVGEWAKAWFDNAFNVLRANTSVGMIALGMTLVIITGGIDLAVGSTLAGVGTVVMVLIDTSPRGILMNLGITGVPAYIIGIVGGFAAGALIGALIGLGVTKGRVPPFIITLGVMNIVRSVAQYFTKSYTPKVPPEFTAISNTVVFGQRLLPILYWLVLAVLLYIVMKRTRFGRYVYAVGSNERTSRLSGINVDRVKFMVYTLMGFLVSVAAVTQVSRLGGMDVASSGSGYELDAIAAVVVGGTSMSGGRGSIVGTVIGVLIIGVMNNLLILLGVDSFLTNAFKGAIVIAAVLVQRKEKEA